MAKLSYVGKRRCSVTYNRDRLGLPPAQCSQWARPGKTTCKGHK